jgi:hypothetical protein
MDASRVIEEVSDALRASLGSSALKTLPFFVLCSLSKDRYNSHK